MKTVLLILFFITTTLFGQSYENIYYHIKVTNKIIGKKIIGDDTIFVLQKKAGCKYVDSLKLDQLHKKIKDYDFILPDSLPNGKYCVFYNDKKENLAFIVNYNSFKKNGPYLNYFYDNKISEYGFYLNNCFDKIRVRYNNSGQVMAIYNYENCLLEGSCFNFANTGELYMMTTYHNGKKNGKVITYQYDKKHFPKIQYNYDYKDNEHIK